jgi:hypothetical protein
MPEVTFGNLFEHWPYMARLLITRLEELARQEAQSQDERFPILAANERREILAAINLLEYSKASRF